ncbi:MAG: transglutaminase domain-containing protein [Ruminococcus sp.]
MRRLQFYYSTKLTFNHHVQDHSYLLRCIPMETMGQHIVQYHFSMLPNQYVNESTDAFGNRVLSGFIASPHRYLDFVVQGIAERDDSIRKTDFMPCYRYQTAMTKPDAAMLDFFQQCKSVSSSVDSLSEQIKIWMHQIFTYMQYEKRSTDVTTTAAQAFAAGKGVCQDYTHIFLSLLRMQQIPCRYLAGLAFQEGETHSWLEYWDGSGWVGIDPTNDRTTDEGYLVLSQGRDAQDCSLSRGTMFGAYTQQMQWVETRLETIFSAATGV